jgi:hypothetical protein
MWTLHSGATYAFTYQGKEGMSLNQYVCVANDIPFNPEGIIERVSDDLQEKIDQFEEREDALRERFQDAIA